VGQRSARVVIVNLQPPGDREAFLPYLWGTLRAYAEQFADLRNSVVFAPAVWRMAPLDELLDDVGAPDICGIGLYAWNARNSLRLGRALKARHPACRIVCGGPQVPNQSTAFLDRHPYVDLCVHGEGEEAFAGVLRESLQPRPDWGAVPGISYRDGGRTHRTESRRLPTLDFPSPYLAGYFDGAVADIADRGFRPVAFLETNRGCPYSCSFCDWGMATMSKIRQFPEDRVLAELEWMSRHRLFGIVVCDANFGIFSRDLGFIRHLGQLKAETGAPRRVKITGFAKNNKERPFEVMQLLKAHRLLGSDPSRAVNFSVQSMSQTTLDAIARTNIPLDGYRRQSDLYRASGDTITPDLILPLPGETAASFKAGYADLAALDHVAHIVVYPCIVLPNAPMASPTYRERWGLVTKTVRVPAPADGLDDEEEEIVVATAAMTEAELADCKVFVSVVEAFEVVGILAAVREYLTRTRQVAVAPFYDDFIRWQLSRQAGLASALAAARANALANPTQPLAWGQATADHPPLSMFRRVRSSKVVMYDALSQPQHFMQDLRGFLRENYGWTFADEEEELLRFQAETWITPHYDPREPADRPLEYAYDWPSFFDGREAAPARRPTRMTCLPRHEWLERGYSQVSVIHWLKYALAPGTDRTMQCCRLRRPLSR
jgi:2-(S-pantetheinyl)-carbapenam-3-carboxylate methyltransferase